MSRYYNILPRVIEDGNQIIDKMYKQLCLLNLLQGKHPLIPEVIYTSLSIRDLGQEKYTTVPINLSSEDLELLSLYEQDEIDNLKQEFNTSKYNEIELAEYQEAGFFKVTRNSLQKGITDITRLILPVPSFSEEVQLFLYQEISAELPGNSHWINQLVDFFDLLTNEQLLIEGLTPDDFLYDHNGNIKYFLGYNNLTIITDKQSLLEKNLNALAHLLNRYYIEDTEKNQATLYQQKWFGKIEGRLISPLVYNRASEKLYNDFQEILLDLDGQFSYSKNLKRIGVFLDTANIFSAMYHGVARMEIKFDKLLAEVFGQIESRKIKRKIAVIFLPKYGDSSQVEDKLEMIFSARDYLDNCGFQVVIVENEDSRAKKIIAGEEYDIDDQKLIELMRNSLAELDSILLLSGDRHFYQILREYQNRGKEVKVISVSRESTYQGYLNSFDHQYIDEYWQCIDFV